MHPRGHEADEHDRPDSVWNRAIRTREHVDPFCCRTEWQLSYHEVFAPSRRLRVHTLDDSVAAFAERTTPEGRRLLEPVESGWCFGCPLLGPDALDALEQLLDDPQFAAEPPIIEVSGLSPRGSLRRRLVARFADRWSLAPFAEIESVQVWASLRGGLDGYLSRRSAKTRRNVRAAARRIRDAGVVFERHAPSDALAAAAIYRRMVDVERRSWKGIGRCGMAEPGSLQYYAAMLRRLSASGGGRVILARHPDQGDVGFIFGGMHGPVYRGQQFSFVENWRGASLGNVLQLEQVRWLCDERASRYDMGPVMDYKRHWTERHGTLTAVRLLPTDR